MIPILRSESHFLLVNKPAGLFSQAAAGVASLERELIQQIKHAEQHSGSPFVGLPHRLDRETSGVMLIARNQRALKRFGQQFQSRKIGKFYLAVVETMLPPTVADRRSFDQEAKDQRTKLTDCRPADPVAVQRPLPLPLVDADTCNSEDTRTSHMTEAWTDWIRKVPDEARAEIVPPNTAGARQAELEAVQIATTGTRSLLLIRLLTGRMHQIRVQAAARGLSVLGDAKYGSSASFGSEVHDPQSGRAHRNMALHALRIEFRHPQSGLLESGTAETPATWKQLPSEIYQACLTLAQKSSEDKNLSWTRWPLGS